MLAARTVAMITVLPLGGIVGDRMSRRGLTIASDGVRAGRDHRPGAASTASHAAGPGRRLAFARRRRPSRVFQPAYGALMPGIVPAKDLVSANSLTAVAARARRCSGPPSAAPSSRLAGVRLALVVDAATFAVSSATLIAVRDAAAGRAHGQRRPYAATSPRASRRCARDRGSPRSSEWR